jgi:hypothetical protein
MVAAGLGLVPAPAGAGLVNAAGARLLEAEPLLEPVHCRRWLPHRHSGAKPHGLGFGCGKKARPARSRR